MTIADLPLITELNDLAAQNPQIHLGETPGVYFIYGRLAGTSLTICGGIHGNEPCGYLAIKQIIEEVNRNALIIERGVLTLVIGNPAALVSKQRAVDQNLNRLFIDAVACDPASVESMRAAQLKPILAKAEVLCDLHATTAQTRPFLMCEKHLIDQARAIGISPIVSGWGDMSGSILSGDTENYVNSKGGQGYTVECGQRDDPTSGIFAYETALHFMRFFNLVAQPASPPQDTPATYILFQHQALRVTDFVYSRRFENFTFLPQNTEIGRDSQGPLVAPEDCVIIMPADPKQTKIGEELFLLARSA